MLTFGFWVAGFAAIYSYCLYPLLLAGATLLRKSDAQAADSDGAADKPFISLIVTAYNEEKRIVEKLENCLELAYPAEKLEIIVASDCSDDQTDQLVGGYSDKGIKLVRASDRLGKENAQLTAIQAASGEVLVFSDVATKIPSEALERLAKYFQDPSVGAVSSEDRFISKDGSLVGEGAYVKYEMWLRKLESELSGLVGLSGSFFAARKSICTSWDIHAPSDFNTALNAARAGTKAVTAPDVLGFYTDLADPAKEYARKVRTVIRGMTGLARHKEVMNIGRFGFYALQVISHKLMRWLAPWFFILFFILSAMTASEGMFYGLVFAGQIGFYGVALVAHFLPELRAIGPIKIIYFFVQVHIALLDAGIKFLSGKRMTTWKPSAR